MDLSKTVNPVTTPNKANTNTIIIAGNASKIQVVKELDFIEDHLSLYVLNQNKFESTTSFNTIVPYS